MKVKNDFFPENSQNSFQKEPKNFSSHFVIHWKNMNDKWHFLFFPRNYQSHDYEEPLNTHTNENMTGEEL